MQTEWYVFIKTTKGEIKKLGGPYVGEHAQEKAKRVEHDANSCLARPPFAYTVPWTPGY